MSRPHRLVAFVFGLFVVISAVLGACGEDSEVVFGQAGSGGVGANASGGSSSGDGGTVFAGGGPPGCSNDDDCNGGVCNNCSCCDTADLVCADGCCAVTEVCLFDGCVTPGDDCVSEADCPEDHYCEPALGEDTGQGGAGANCTQPLIPGKCLPLPPICTGEATDPPDCVDDCQYVPPVGQLNAVVQWQWGYDPVPIEYPSMADVWATPAVARIFDANCDGTVDLADPPNVVFVSGDSLTTYCSNNGVTNYACRKGVLRMLDGKSGEEIWSLAAPSGTSQGFAGTSVAVGDMDQDQRLDIVALSGEGNVVIVSDDGIVKHISDDVVLGATNGSFGWGGAISLGDMDNDGWPEIAYGASVFTMDNGSLGPLFNGTGGAGTPINVSYVSHFVDLDGNGDLELLAGRTAYHHDGSTLWNNASADGFTATGDFDGDNLPEIVVVQGGQLRILEGLDGSLELGPVTIPGSGTGGPPTVANFDGLPGIEIGVAKQNLYSVMKPNYTDTTIDPLWSTSNHDNSSSVTGSSVFDFEGDGKAEVIYNDECFVWVYDGATGDVLFTANTMSFTATEATIVADVDGDGHAEVIMGSNGANPSTWSCAHHTGTDSYPAWAPPPTATNYRGITVFADVANSWVGTRTLWNQHAYSVSNICDPRDSACQVGSYYGQIPTNQNKNWLLPWLNNFRQNVQDEGLFDAPDVTVALSAQCVTPVVLEAQVRNIGLAGLPTGIEVGLFRIGNPEVQVGSVFTSKDLFPGQTDIITFDVPENLGGTSDSYQARVIIPVPPNFNECKDDNNDSEVVTPECVQ